MSQVRTTYSASVHRRPGARMPSPEGWCQRAGFRYKEVVLIKHVLPAIKLSMLGRPASTEAAPYYFTYIDQVVSDDVLPVIERQLQQVLSLCSEVSEEKSLHRYAPDKWSIRQVLNHVTDTERAFAFRALWFARGFQSPLPDYDQNIAAAGADADQVAWSEHVEEFRRVRLATISLFRNLPADAWLRTGIASNNRFTVRAMAFITAGHVEHHLKILRERYL